ncbi:MAG: hypothetical protein HQK49_11430 [Oligoflexia bacterium]|nr:hypothetical protein [Oligoflexia bacterium]
MIRFNYILILFLLATVNITNVAVAANTPSLSMAPLEITNRASCAILSNYPARSIFLFVDGFSAGKAAYSAALAQRFGRDANATTTGTNTNNSIVKPGDYSAEGVKLFRLWVTHLAVDILNKILDGELPLLPIDEEDFWPEYRAANKACINKNQLLSCPEMNDFLAKVWSYAHLASSKSVDSKYLKQQREKKWQKLGVSLEDDFYPSYNRPKVGCHIVKKFSTMHSHLFTQKVDQGILENIAIDSINPEKHLNSCFAFNDDIDPRFANIQLDMAQIPNDKVWDQYGFRVWHTLKLFLSWGWRYAPQMLSEFEKFDREFRSIAFEDSVMIIPNGCRSVDIPRCDKAGLSVDAMRAAKFLGTAHAAVSEVPLKPIDMLLRAGPKPVNDDPMDLRFAENADVWYRDFKDKLFAVRGSMIEKFNSSLAKLEMITYLLDADTLSKDILKLLDSKTMSSSTSAAARVDANELYLSCIEYRLARNQLFDDINKEISSLSKTSELDALMMASKKEKLKKYVSYYQKIQDTMDIFCSEMERRKRLQNANEGLKNALNEWSYRLLYSIEIDKFDPLYCSTEGVGEKGEKITVPLKAGCPQNLDNKYLAFEDESGLKKMVMCKSALECSRIVLKSVVSIMSIRRYSEAFLPLKDVINSPSLFNTFTMPTACKLYDPFYKKRTAFKFFIADLASAVLMGATCGALNFTLLEPTVRRVESFTELQDQYVTTYEPNIRTIRPKFSVGLDLGFLTGIPCGFSFSNSVTGPTIGGGGRGSSLSSAVPVSMGGNSPIGYGPGAAVASAIYTGIDLNLCKSKRKIDVLVNSGAGITGPMSTSVVNDIGYRVCFQCSLNFYAVANAVRSGFAQTSCIAGLIHGDPTGYVIGAASAIGIGIFQGLIRLYSNLRDPDNIAHAGAVDIDLVGQTYDTYGTIPKRCVYRLKRGYACR